MEPTKLKRVVIKEEFFVLFKNDCLKALILNQFLYWTERVRDLSEFILEETKETNELKAGWIYKSCTKLAEEIMYGANKTTIRTAIKEIINLGYLYERDNQFSKIDKTKQYRVNLVKIHNDLKQIGYNGLEGYKFTETIPEQYYPRTKIVHENKNCSPLIEIINRDCKDIVVNNKLLTTSKPAVQASFDRQRYSVAKELNTKEKETLFEPSVSAKEVVDHWNKQSCNDKKLPQLNTSALVTYKKTCLFIDKLRSGTTNIEIFKGKKYRRQDIISAIDRFALTALNDEYNPVGKTKERLRKISLMTFLFNERSGNSCLLNSLQYEPMKKGAFVKKNATVVETICNDYYTEYCLEKNKMQGSTANDWNNFAKTEERLGVFLQENRWRLNITEIVRNRSFWYGKKFTEEEALACFLVEYLKEKKVKYAKKGNDLQSSWFCSDNTFNQFLGYVLSDMNMIKH